MLRRLIAILIAGLIAVGALLAYSAGADIPGPAPSAAEPGDGLPTAPGPTSESAMVVRVVDGDTLVIDRGRGDERVRLVGVDTPESVAPNAPVECFGPEASSYLTGLLSGKRVTIEIDASQGDTDRYGRLLRYVWIAADAEAWHSVEALLLTGGYAEPYRDAHTRKAGFDALAADAQAAGLGLWGSCS